MGPTLGLGDKYNPHWDWTYHPFWMEMATDKNVCNASGPMWTQDITFRNGQVIDSYCTRHGK